MVLVVFSAKAGEIETNGNDKVVTQSAIDTVLQDCFSQSHTLFYNFFNTISSAVRLFSTYKSFWVDDLTNR